MSPTSPVNLWGSAAHASDYLGRADAIPHRSEGEATLVEFVPANPRRILDLGTGDGRLLARVKTALSTSVEALAVDFSPAMLEAAGTRFAGDSSVTIVSHNLAPPLPALWKVYAAFFRFSNSYPGA